MTGTARLLARSGAPLTRWPALAVAALAGGSALLVVAVAAWGARFGWFDGGLWVAVVWGIAVFLLGAGLRRARTLLAQDGARLAAQLLESRAEWRAGMLTSLLAPPADGTSPDLLADADRNATTRLGEAVAHLEPTVGGLRRRALGAITGLGVAALLLGASRPTHGPAGLLWDPHAAWLAATAPLRVVAPDSAVDRGTAVPLTLVAVGHRTATLWLRAPGEAWRPVPVTLDESGRGRYLAGPLAADLFARLVSGGRESDTATVHVRIPAFLGSVEVTAHYPAYLHLAPEPLPLDGDTLLLPAGTRLETRGEATTPLGRATWVGPAARGVLATDGNLFHGDLLPERSGIWRLGLTTRSGAALAGDSTTLPIRLVPDSAPVVEIPVPGTDTVVPLSLQVPLVVEGRDDHGLSRLVLESRRVTSQGEAAPVRSEALTLPSGGPDHVVVPVTLDLRDRGVLPGDTVRVRVRAWDAAPVAHEGASREYAFRLARPDEVRAAARAVSQSIARQLDSAAAGSKRLERTTQDLANQQTRTEAGGRSDRDDALDYQAAQRAQEVARDQQAMIDQAQAVRDQLEQLQRASAEAGASDPDFQRQLEDVRRELDRALTPELRQQLERLDRALQDLDADRTRDALRDLARSQQQLREALERSRELFRRAALEGDLANLQQESRELADAQEQWDQAAPTSDSARAAAVESRLADRTDSLGAALARTADQLHAEGRQAAMDSSATAAREAAQQMRQAAGEMRAGDRQHAQRSGEQAQQRLGQVPRSLQQQRDALQSAWREAVKAQLDAALQEMARLTAAQLDVSEGFQRGDAAASLRQRQGAVEEGTQRVMDQLRDAAGKNALVAPQLGLNLATARQQMQQARQALEPATPNFRQGAERAGAAVDALNAVALQLMRSRGNVGSAQSGSGMPEAMAQMSALAQEQGGVSQGAQSLIPMPGQGVSLPALAALAQRQREIAQQLDRLRAGGQVPGASELANEARDLARQLEAGRMDRPTAERQERLFHRMLDAGRTLQGQQEDQQKARQSTSATGDSVHLPPALQARLTDPEGHLQMPTWDELQRFAPEERRLVVEYFRRLAEKP